MMKLAPRFLLLPFLLLAALAPSRAAQTGNNVFLQGDYVEVGIHAAGSFGTGTAAPAGFHTQGSTALGFVVDAGRDGWNVGTPARTGDFITPGTVEEGWSVAWTGSIPRIWSNFGANTGQDIATSTASESGAGTLHTATWEGTASTGGEALRVTQVVTLGQSDLFFTVHVTLTNTGTATLNGVKYLRSIDPDMEYPLTSNYSTKNFVVNDDGTGQRLAVAKGANYASSYLGLGAIDPRAVVSVESIFAVRNPDDVLLSPVTPAEASAVLNDGPISIAYALGSLAPGESTELEFAYLFADVPLDSILGGSGASLAIVSPAGTAAGTVNFRARAFGATAPDSVEFFVNGSSLGSVTTRDAANTFEIPFDSTTLPNGTTPLRVVATYPDASTIERTRTVEIANPGPPVAFIAPADGATFSGSTNAVEVAGTDASHPPQRVRFFRVVGRTEVSLGEDSSAPFTANFGVTDLADGTSVTIKAVAFDSLDRETTIGVTGMTPVATKVGNEVFLKGDVVEVGVNSYGSFGTSAFAPAGFHPQGFSNLGMVADTQRDGWTNGTPGRTGDFVLPGSPEEGWSVSWGGGGVFANSGLNGRYGIAPTFVAEDRTAEAHTAVWQGTALGVGGQQLKVTQTVRLGRGDLYFTVHVVLQNTGSATLNAVKYLRSIDSDPEDVIGFGGDRNFVRNDDTTGQRLVIDKGTAYPSSTFLGLGTIDPRATVSVENAIGVTDPDEVLGSPYVPGEASPDTGDNSLNLAFDLGALAPGQTTEFDFAYLLADADLATVLGVTNEMLIFSPHGSVAGKGVPFRVKPNKAVAATQVEFFVDGTSLGMDLAADGAGVFEKSFDVDARPNGPLTLRAVATFADTSTVERTFNVVVANPGPPIEFVRPIGGSAFFGATTPIVVRPTDPLHRPVSVRFSALIGGYPVDLGEDAHSPYLTTLDVTGYGGGDPVEIHAIGVDAQGRETDIAVNGYVGVSLLAAIDDQLLVINGTATAIAPLRNDETGGGDGVFREHAGGALLLDVARVQPGRRTRLGGNRRTAAQRARCTHRARNAAGPPLRRARDDARRRHGFDPAHIRRARAIRPEARAQFHGWAAHRAHRYG